MRYLLALLLLVLASPALAMEHYSRPLQDQYGRIIGNATVTVYLAGTTTKATIYSDNGTTLKSNPFTTPFLTGQMSFYAANGRYDILPSKAGYTFTAADWAGITLVDPTTIVSGGGASTFDQLGAGTNITAAMVVGTGASMTYSGSGVINANQLKGNTVVAVADGGTGLSTAVDDAVNIGNGSILVSTVLPSCSNATTSKLLYNTSTNAFTCGTDQSSGGGTTFDAIGGGTNITANLVVGSGAALFPSGVGVITATSLWPRSVTVNAGNSPYTPSSGDFLLLCDTTAGARTVNLPAATGKEFYSVKNLGSSACTINRNGTDTIDGATSAVLTLQYDALFLISNASNAWEVF